MTNIKIHPDREKVSGRMWGGSAEANINGVKIGLQMWHHGGDNETVESLKEHFYIKFVNGKDASWHTVIREDGLWFHEEGWFGFNREDFIKQVFGDNDWNRIPIIEDLTTVGFINFIPNNQE